MNIPPAPRFLALVKTVANPVSESVFPLLKREPLFQDVTLGDNGQQTRAEEMLIFYEEYCLGINVKAKDFGEWHSLAGGTLFMQTGSGGLPNFRIVSISESPRGSMCALLVWPD